MPKVSSYFDLNLSQAQLDFVDIDTDRDTPLYLDPYAISIKENSWSLRCTDHLISYFDELISCIRANKDETGRNLMSNLHEPRETYLGVSKGKPKGTGIGPGQGRDLYNALKKSRAAKTGLLTDLSEMSLFVEHIGPDKISDMTTNIVRRCLVDYTKEQCELLSIPTEHVASAPMWIAETKRWENDYVHLPVIEGKAVLLIPKASVRWHVSLESQEFYNHTLSFLRAEHLRVHSALVETLKNGKQRVTRKKLEERYPYSKNHLAEFVEKYPNLLDTYKKVKGAEGSLTNRELERDFDEKSFARSLRAELRKIPPGRETAHLFHRFTAGTLTFIFYPALITPSPEHPVNDGRKRIDILYTNAAETGFFARMQRSPQTRSNFVTVECKNYAKEIGNPDVDQLAGRLTPKRGNLGLLIARSFSNREQVIQRCRDVANDHGKYVFPICDEDIDYFLDCTERVNQSAIDRRLEEILSEISS